MIIKAEDIFIPSNPDWTCFGREIWVKINRTQGQAIQFVPAQQGRLVMFNFFARSLENREPGHRFDKDGYNSEPVLDMTGFCLLGEVKSVKIHRVLSWNGQPKLEGWIRPNCGLYHEFDPEEVFYGDTFFVRVEFVRGEATDPEGWCAEGEGLNPSSIAGPKEEIERKPTSRRRSAADLKDDDSDDDKKPAVVKKTPRTPPKRPDTRKPSPKFRPKTVGGVTK
jgi:hypothetical protein